MEIGERLREAREAKGITLESLQETTKIQKRYLVAIEQSNFHILPGKFYARAFIKEYALAVDLKPDDLLAEFGEEVPKVDSKNTEQYSRMQRSRRQDNTSKSPAFLSAIPTIIVVLLIIGIIFVAITLYQKSMSDKDNDPDNQQGQNEVIRKPDNTNQETNDKEVIEDEEDKETNNNKDSTGENDNQDNSASEPALDLIEAGSGQKPESTFEFIHKDDKVILRFEPSGISWLDIINENSETIFQVMTVENEAFEVDVTGNEKVRLNIGYAPALSEITINDIAFIYPVDANKFVNQRIWIQITNETE